jgi:hypothetical protein
MPPPHPIANSPTHLLLVVGLLIALCNGITDASGESSAGREADKLREIRKTAASNGVDDLELLGRSDVQDLEPALETSCAALLSPSTGIVDSHRCSSSSTTSCTSCKVITAPSTIAAAAVEQKRHQHPHQQNQQSP